MNNILITWKFIKNNNIIIGNTDNFRYNSSIVITKLKNIFIEKKYKKKQFNEYNWIIKHKKNIYNKIKEIRQKQGSIIFLETINISHNFKNKKELINYMQNIFRFYVDILSKLDLEALIIISLLPNTYFDLPFTGLFDIISNLYKQKNMSINIKKSIMIGNNAGRKRTRYYNRYDYNCNDRAFSYNIGLAFVVSEDFFYKKYHNFYWKWNKNLPKKKEINKYLNITKKNKKNLLKNIKLIEDKLLPNNINIIICYGPPLFEKKIICQQIAKYLESSNSGKIQIWDKNIKKNNISNKYKICIFIVDYVNKKNIKILNDVNINKIYFKINISIPMAILLNNIFIQKSKNEKLKKINNINYSLYISNIKKDYENSILYEPNINKINELFFKY